MKRVVKLTERDLNRIVRNVLSEALVVNRFDAVYQAKPGVQNTAWPQKAGATGTWKEEGGSIVLYNANNETIGVVTGS